MNDKYADLIKELATITRPLSKIEAAFDLSINPGLSVSAYSKRWQWSRWKVRAFLRSRGFTDTKPTLYRHPKASNGKRSQGCSDKKPTLNRHPKCNNGVIEKIISDLNIKAGTNYKTTSKQTIKLIEARLNEGFTVEDFFKVHTNKCHDWMNDPKYRKYIRPATLYAPTKFEGYLNQGFVDETNMSDVTAHNLAVLRSIEEGDY